MSEEETCINCKHPVSVHGIDGVGCRVCGCHWRWNMTKAANEIIALRQEIASRDATELARVAFLQSAIGTRSMEHLVVRFKELQDENARFRKALEDYADTEMWLHSCGENHDGESDFRDVWCDAEDGWERAKHALGIEP